ncbi:RDD family protein [Corynebacterium spheniscorum]|uniref:RDD family protein n=1 Tax=Corynebacterium spheniscorum TaxID=185761 RepID=A0A1I2PXB5_9CORY|nr:RDD family protein [Corynebacterium spheniscorum]KAA8723411.1 hypothetical protein F4V56_02925 [Corynebacterium spheniscorum]SFG18647.1 RDD family protein [Corynebacterium spheniscorum]
MSSAAGFNLYRWLDVPQDAPSKDLGTLICEMDAALDRNHYPDRGGMREKLYIANSVLTNESRRAIYDQHLGHTHSWNQVEYLANFDRWPNDWEVPSHERLFRVMEATQEPEWEGAPRVQFKEPEQEPDPFPINPYAASYQAPYPAPIPGPGPYTNFETARDRTTAPLILRGIMLVIDIFFITLFTSLVASGSAEPVVGAVAALAYFVGCEVYFGGTLAKRFFGYEVRNAETGAKLTPAESFKRNFWRFIVGLPWLGTLFAGPIFLVLGLSLAFSADGRGLHDRFADAEVVQKG